MTQALLLSGGMDSAAIAWWRRPELCVFIDYGQRPARAERRAAAAVADACGSTFRAIAVDCSAIGSGLLAGTTPMDLAPGPEWWPYRNQLLVTLAASVAIRHGSTALLIGTIAEDSANGDGTERFVEALDAVLACQEGGLRLSAPAIGMSARDLVGVSGIPDEVLGWTHSCFVSDIPCLKCRGCTKHLTTLDRSGRRR
jgi:7-cyano-7-deazaguanine synthase